MAAPKLRFKEFDGDWSLSSLSKISSIITGNTPSTSNREYYDGEFLFVSPADIQENRYIEKTKTTLTANGFSKCRHIPENSVLFVCIGSTIGKVAQNKVICATNQQINAVIPQKGYSSDFLYLQLERLAPNIKLNAGVQAVPLINKTEFGKTLLNTPVYIEQTKIASFLSAVDEKISQLTQKHELLSQYKQGMMQKLFSQEIRFKADDGSEFGAWKHCKLKDVLISYRLGGNYSNAEMVTSYPLIKMGNLGRGSINLDKIEYIPEDQIIDPEDLIKKNDLFFNTRNTLDLVGKVALWRGELPIAYYNSNLLRLDFENNIFMNYLFNEQKTLEKLKAIASGTTSVAAIYTKDLLKINLEIPCLEEQNKIASFLSSIDQKIEVVAQQIEQAKTWKKGLLQQMFV
ncbi:restriction endonuclease subunit S [Acinetobacter towneri]|uniref:restriction endonuclease subunit S n=1 Tax=Acinetobacter towneri TaxID=202956 RepID=UPI0025767DE0|nr:restriction endonuclease subunit S [Acinetobacter towneri]MDM1487525.1 restriction endonuclease subunit S [Acinetobacter towneri]